MTLRALNVICNIYYLPFFSFFQDWHSKHKQVPTALLSKDTQNKVIESFKNGKIKILVSTTIVEVGIDIPDSDIMVIATPERFGLASLHQLRGRVGRNGEKARHAPLSYGRGAHPSASQRVHHRYA